MTHWKKLTNPDYLGAYALEDGKDIILTIDYVRRESVTGTDGKKEDCVVCHFTERGVKPMILNKTNCKTIEKVFGTPDIEQWSNRKIQIGVEKVKAFGDIWDALRVRKFLPQIAEEKILCESCGKEIRPHKTMSAKQFAEYTRSKKGKALCYACAKALAEKEQSDAE